MLIAIASISIPVISASHIPYDVENYCDNIIIKNNHHKFNFMCDFAVDHEQRLVGLQNNVTTLQSLVYEVITIDTALTDERFDIEARCNAGDALLGDYVSYTISPSADGYSGGSGPVMDDNPGNATRQIQVGWYMNLNNRDNISTTFPITGEVSILCVQHP